jgi:hypothetical protein
VQPYGRSQERSARRLTVSSTSPIGRLCGVSARLRDNRGGSSMARRVTPTLPRLRGGTGIKSNRVSTYLSSGDGIATGILVFGTLPHEAVDRRLPKAYRAHREAVMLRYFPNA